MVAGSTGSITAWLRSSCRAPAGRGLLHQTPFESSFTAMTRDGAEWAVEHLADLQLVGIDYTSVRAAVRRMLGRVQAGQQRTSTQSRTAPARFTPQQGQRAAACDSLAAPWCRLPSLRMLQGPTTRC